MTIIICTYAGQPALIPGEALLADALDARGVSVSIAPWDAIDPGRVVGAALCLRSTWDYHERWPEFRTWLDRCQQAAVRMINPLPTVRWNIDKIYLRDFASRGIAVPPAVWIAPGERVTAAMVASGLDALQVETAVLKPRVSASAYGTERVVRGTEPAAATAAVIGERGGLLQAFVPEIVTRGELSLVFFAGAFSHAARKTAAAGDFRVQADHGGQWTHVDVPPLLVAAATRMLRAVTHPWTYVRVDLVETAAGPVLMELELFEPELFLTPDSADRFAGALIAALSGPPGSIVRA